MPIFSPVPRGLDDLEFFQGRIQKRSIPCPCLWCLSCSPQSKENQHHTRTISAEHGRLFPPSCCFFCQQSSNKKQLETSAGILLPLGTRWLLSTGVTHCSLPQFLPSPRPLQVTQVLLWTVAGLTLRQNASEKKKPKKYWALQPCNYLGVYKTKCVRSEQTWRADLAHGEKYHESSVSKSAYFNSFERSFRSCARLPRLFSTGQDILSDYSSMSLNLYSWVFLNGTCFCTARREIKEENYPIMFLSI